MSKDNKTEYDKLLLFGASGVGSRKMDRNNKLSAHKIMVKDNFALKHRRDIENAKSLFQVDAESER